MSLIDRVVLTHPEDRSNPNLQVEIRYSGRSSSGIYTETVLTRAVILCKGETLTRFVA